jgi:hypothetical protein
MEDTMNSKPSDDDGLSLPPHDLEAERLVLAAMLWAAPQVEAAAEILSPEDFFRPGHQVLFREMVTMWAAGEPIDPVTLREWLARSGDLQAIGGPQAGPMYLAGLYSLRAPGQVSAHAGIVRDRSVRRRLLETAARLDQMARTPGNDPGEILARAEAEIGETITRTAAESAMDELASAEAFLAQSFTRLGPVIPGLLDHEDRVVLVGLEGTGKSTLARQMAVAAAAGRHPFLNAEIRPVRSLIVDLENPRPLLQKAMGKLQLVAKQFPSYQPGRVMVFSRPGGMDLRNARDSYRLADAIRRAKPDLIVAGPVYKMFADNGDSSEQIHSGVTRFWDMIRERTGATLWLETHAPIASNYGKGRLLRPLGSGIWTRWPEFGIALVDSGKGEYLLDRFRGDREEGRNWPMSLQRNQWPDTGWPFTVRQWGDQGVPLEEAR